MKNNYLKKYLAVAVLFLVINLSVITSSVKVTENDWSIDDSIKYSYHTLKSDGSGVDVVSIESNTLYVGGEGSGNYSKIQDAIDNASDGDTVFVYSGVYNDFFPINPYGYSVLINKSINLVGENKHNTIINGTQKEDVVRVQASGVNISGFTIQNSGRDRHAGINLIDIYYKKITIFNNIIVHNCEGIFIFRNSQIHIYNNTISYNEVGIEFIDGYNILISNNFITNNSIGLDLNYGERSSIVYFNQIQDNELGIEAENSRFTIKSNNFINNEKHMKVLKGVHCWSIFLIPITRLKCNSNYWDNWNKTFPKPILSSATIHIIFMIGGTITYIPILKIPNFQFDRHPVKAPYDIEV